jgi:ferrochelatase
MPSPSTVRHPQYAAASTATACDEAFRALMRLRWQPAVRVAPAYYDDPVYIGALADSIRGHLPTLGFEPEALIASFHGMPQRYLEAGDPYHCQCQKTARLLREKLSWPVERWHTTFQSRFGREPWLQPSTIEEVARLAKSGVTRIIFIAMMLRPLSSNRASTRPIRRRWTQSGLRRISVRSMVGSRVEGLGPERLRVARR